jgi:RimJ/RimL family protein N-acetyltransferase
MVNFILPTKETWDVDKYALLLKGSERRGGEGGGEEKLKMIGFVGTNRWCELGMEVGYCANIAYWGRGFISEGFTRFLELYWTLPGTFLSFSSFLGFWPLKAEADGSSERKNVTRLVAKTHPENGASQRVCAKCGGKKGEVLKESYERFVDGGVKSDVWLFYFDRPGVEVKDGSGGRTDVATNLEGKQEEGQGA